MAVSILKREGVEEDKLLSEITKLFYVDLDTFNEVLEAVPEHRPDLLKLEAARKPG